MDLKEGTYSDYRDWLKEIKGTIRKSRNQVALSVNSQLLELYWYLGKEISIKRFEANWGSKIMEQLSIDLKHEFPELRGFSRRNLYAISQWYNFYSKKFEFVPRSVAQLPWRHNMLIVSKIKNVDKAIDYSKLCLSSGWTREQLEQQIESKLLESLGQSSNNFSETLGDDKSLIAAEIIKDPYNFDFLSLHDSALKREIENELVNHITKFLLELGKGFAYVGRQYQIVVSDKEYFIDLLFYHLELQCYVVIELKAGKFKPEYAGKLNFYLSAFDSQIKKLNDNPTIGLILCKKKDKIEAEYSLRDLNKPIGISEYKLTESIPENLKTKLPSIEEIEQNLEEKLKSNNT